MPAKVPRTNASHPKGKAKASGSPMASSTSPASAAKATPEQQVPAVDPRDAMIEQLIKQLVEKDALLKDADTDREKARETAHKDRKTNVALTNEVARLKVELTEEQDQHQQFVWLVGGEHGLMDPLAAIRNHVGQDEDARKILADIREFYGIDHNNRPEGWDKESEHPNSRWRLTWSAFRRDVLPRLPRPQGA